MKNTSPATILKRFGYAYDPVGNRTSEQVDNAVNSATPNNLNQLISRQGGGKMRFFGTLGEPATVTVGGTPASVATNSVLSSYTFDGFADVTVGTNIVPVVAKGGGGIARTNRYQVVVSSGITQTLTYDPSGNLVSHSGGGSSTTYEWDAVNRLKAINSGTHRTEFTYDGYSRRVRTVEKDNGAVTSDKRLLWDGTRIAEERDSTGANVTKRYFEQGVQVGTANYCYTRDHLGSIRELTDTSAAIHAHYDYDPYGRRTKVSGDLDADFGFTGHYYHAPSGLHLAMYRAYDADLGRWLSRDPIEEKGGVNLYAYVSNNPMNWLDPIGLESEETDDAGRRCCRSAMKTVKLKVDDRDIVGHAFIELPDGRGRWGFHPDGPKGPGLPDYLFPTPPSPGTAGGDEDYIPNETSTRTYKLCPESLKQLGNSIKQHSRDRYSLGNHGARNCAGWVCERLKDAGIKPPQRPDLPWLRPIHLPWSELGKDGNWGRW